MLRSDLNVVQRRKMTDFRQIVADFRHFDMSYFSIFQNDGSVGQFDASICDESISPTA